MSALEVWLGHIRVGLLEHPEEFEHRFSFEREYLHLPHRPVLGQLFEDHQPRSIATTGHVPIWFSHLLPQGPLRRVIARSLMVDEEDDLELLAGLGADLPGAVVMTRGKPRLSQLRLDFSAPPSRAAGFHFTALAGAQWKLSVRPEEREITVPVEGETGSWIAKFHDPLFPGLPRVELATMTWAKGAGVEVPACRQATVDEFAELPKDIPIGDGVAFLIERFDREAGGRRIHMEDFGQVLDRPPGDEQYLGRYEHLAAVLSYLSPEDVRPFCERLVFCILCGNTDAHLKNWSLLYPDGRRARLSPAYDLVSSVLYAGPKRLSEHGINDELALTLSGTKRFEDISEQSFRLLAEVTNHPLDEVSTWVREMVDRVLGCWSQEARNLPLTQAERERIDAHLSRVPLAHRRLP